MGSSGQADLEAGRSGCGGALDLTLGDSREPLMDSEEERGRIREWY